MANPIQSNVPQSNVPLESMSAGDARRALPQLVRGMFELWKPMTSKLNTGADGHAGNGGNDGLSAVWGSICSDDPASGLQTTSECSPPARRGHWADGCTICELTGAQQRRESRNQVDFMTQSCAICLLSWARCLATSRCGAARNPWLVVRFLRKCPSGVSVCVLGGVSRWFGAQMEPPIPESWLTRAAPECCPWRVCQGASPRGGTVCENDEDDDVPRVVDSGIAKATPEPLGEQLPDPRGGAAISALIITRS